MEKKRELGTANLAEGMDKGERATLEVVDLDKVVVRRDGQL